MCWIAIRHLLAYRINACIYFYTDTSELFSDFSPSNLKHFVFSAVVRYSFQGLIAFVLLKQWLAFYSPIGL